MNAEKQGDGDMRTTNLSAETWDYEAHIPHGSADAQWRVVAGADLIATVDPEMVMGDPESHARLIAAAPELLAALTACFNALAAVDNFTAASGLPQNAQTDALDAANRSIAKALCVRP